MIDLAEGVGVVFVWVDTSTLMIELKSGQVSKVSDSGVFYSALPFMSFHASAAGTYVYQPSYLPIFSFRDHIFY